MTSIGGLSIQIIADVARFSNDMNAIRGKMDSTGAALSRAGDMVKGALGGMLAGLSVAGMGAWIKSAIDAADETSKLGQKIGVTTQDVAGLQMAFRLSGLESGVMTSSMARLSRGVAENNDALKSLGVQTRDTDGNLRNSRDVLGQVAASFQGMEDGTRKTALAVEIFGKAGADMIPLLNGGAQGLDEMDAMAKKLGLTMNTDTGKQAEKFNDTLDMVKMAGQGVGLQIATQLLPTLTGMAGAFFESVTEGDRLSKAANVLAGALKVVFIVGMGGVEIFNTLGKTLGAVGAAAMAMAQGEFRQAQRILEEGGRDIAQGWSASAKKMQDAWDGTGNAAIENGARILGEQRKAAALAAERAAMAKEAAAAAQQRNAQIKRQQAEQAKRDAELLRIEKAANDERMAMDMRRLKQESDKQNAVDLSVKSAEDMIKAIKQETAMLGLSNVEREISIALLKLEEQGLEKGSYAYKVYGEKIRAAIVDRDQVKASISQAATIGEEWSKLTEEIGQGLTDSLFRAFESGKGFFSTLWNGIRNLFKTTVLRMAIQPVQSAINGVIGGVMGGFAGTASAGQAGGSGAGGIGSLLSGMSGMGGILGTLGGIGSAMGSMGSIFAGGMSAGLSGGLSSAGAMMSAGMTGSGLMMGLGAVAPYLLAAAAIFKAVKHTATHHRGSVVSTGAGGSVTGGGYESHGILGNLSAETDTALRFLNENTVGSLNSLSTAFGGRGGFSAVSKFASDNDDPSIGSFMLRNNGALAGMVGPQGDFARFNKAGEQGFKEFAEAVGKMTLSAVDAIGLPAWAREQFAKLGSGAGMEDFQRVAAAVVQMQNGMRGIQQLVEPLGGVFARVAGLSGDALAQLTQFAGGIEAFGQQVGSFVSNYFNRDEIAGLKASEIQSALAGVGITQDLSTRDEFRKLVEGLDVGSAQGREQLVTLLKVSQSFASVADYLAETGGTLAGAAALAPGGPLSDLLLGGADQQTFATDRVRDSVDIVAERIVELIDVVRRAPAPGSSWRGGGGEVTMEP